MKKAMELELQQVTQDVEKQDAGPLVPNSGHGKGPELVTRGYSISDKLN